MTRRTGAAGTVVEYAAGSGVDRYSAVPAAAAAAVNAAVVVVAVAGIDGRNGSSRW